EVSAAPASRRNREQSIRFANEDESMIKTVAFHSTGTDSIGSDESRSKASAVAGGARSQAKPESIASTSLRSSPKPAFTPVVLPAFGSILPVRTLGKIYTLRSGSSIRLELTRYVSGEGWSLPKGTVLIGQARGSERDRAFVAITG